MKIPHSLFLLYCVALLQLGFGVFLAGFFPMKVAIPGYATLRNNETEPQSSDQQDGSQQAPHEQLGVKPLFQKMIFVLIDALRADFVLPLPGGDLPRMEFVSRLVDNKETFSFLARAHAPTVTMPRIKALTTGGIPGFVDAALNVDSQALQEDNMVSQLQRAGNKMVFYGDDTWMKLFPGHFMRTDGTTSFFVTDYTEVDKNVTRHLDTELSSSDWDVMFLHYLGLDHIGHLAGPRSPLIKPKLQEMDNIVRRIYTAMIERDKKERTSTVLLLCGDHGMSDQGSHGGSSSSETAVPLVFISSQYSHGQGAVYNSNIEVEQIDLAPTLSLMLGLPVPQNSLGTLIIDVLSGLTIRQKLSATYVNAQQLLRVLENNVKNYKQEPCSLSLERATLSHLDWLKLWHENSTLDMVSLGEKTLTEYRRAMQAMRDRVASTLSKYDLHVMAVGIISVWMALTGLLYGHMRGGSDLWLTEDSSCIFLVLGSLGGLLTLHGVVCTSPAASPLLCHCSPLSLGLTGMLLVGGSIWCSVLVKTCSWDILQEVHKQVHRQHVVGLFLLGGTAFHTISLLSSSFVEEEHQTCSLAAVLVCCRIARIWNQTGDKWSHLPDVGDWLVRPEKKLALSMLTAASLATICVVHWRDHRTPVTRCLFLLATLAVYCFRAANGTLLLPGIYDITTMSKGAAEARIVYAIVALLLINAVFHLWTTLSKAQLVQGKNKNVSANGAAWSRFYLDVLLQWTLVSLLLVRAHNISLVAVVVVQRMCLGCALQEVRWMSPSHLTLIHVWLGQAAFFYQGNSNSLATVDLSAGYIGLEEFNLPMVIGLLYLATYAGPIYWVLSLMVHLNKQVSQVTSPMDRSPSTALLQVCFTLALTRALPVAVYLVLVTIERYHLFVWSVFSPKLLYETVHTLLTLSLVICLAVSKVLVK
ncbi:GPI ethanolamine phosphate transferase 2 [Lamellibrachia satsuma]|nr:GPI ethanolamine phosphate transferase 2 [Lamellibrachia satsuma]